MSFGQSLIVYFIGPILSFLSFAIFVYVIMSWLMAFNVINARSQFVQVVLRFLSAIVEPICNPIRRLIPPIGGADWSPLIAILIIWWMQGWFLPFLMTAIG